MEEKMTKSKIFIFFCGFLSIIAVVSPVLAKVNSPGALQDKEVKELNITLEWAAFNDDHAAVDYVIEGSFDIPEGYLPVNCPVSSAKIFNASGCDVTGVVFTSCRVMGKNKYSVTQFFYNDFRETSPELLEILIGEIELMPVGDGEIRQLSLIGAYTFDGQFKKMCDITAHPDQVKQGNGVSLVVDRVDFTPNMIKVDAYITLPDTRDWIPDVYILEAGKRIKVDEWFIPNYKEDPGIFERTERFYTFLFHNDIPDFRQMETGAISFGVGEVYTNIPEAIDAKGLEKIKNHLEKYGLRPQLDKNGYYSFMIDITESKLEKRAKADLFGYIKETLTERVPGPLEVKIR